MIGKLDVDTAVLFSLPLLLGLCFWLLPQEYWFFCTGIAAALATYELIVYHRREVYGFSGLNLLTIPSIILLSYTVIIAAPSAYVCVTRHHPAVYPFFFSIIGFYVLFPLGMLLADKQWPIDYQRLQELRARPFKATQLDRLVGEFLVIWLLIGLGLYVLYVSRLKTIPIVELLTSPGAAEKFGVLRQESFLKLKVSSLEKYLILWQRSIIMPVGMLCSLFLYTVYRRKKYLILVIAFFAAGLSFNSLSLEKAPTGAVFMAVMAFLYLKKQHFSLKFVLLSIFLVFLLPVSILYLKYYVDHPDIVNYLIIALRHRILVVPSDVIYLHFEMIPDHVPFLLGRTSQLFSWMHADGGFNLPHRLAQYWFKYPQTSVHANANFLANFWADFGALGVTFSSFFVGVIVHWLYRKILVSSQYRKSIVYMVMIPIVMPIFTVQFLSSNFTTLFFSSGLILLIVFLFILDRQFVRNKILS